MLLLHACSVLLLASLLAAPLSLPFPYVMVPAFALIGGRAESLSVQLTKALKQLPIRKLRFR